MIRVLELFGGIGSCTKAIKNLGINYEIVDYVENDKFAVNSYNAINNTNFQPQDITKWDKNVSVDLIMHGSPCQDFSLIGTNAGGDEGSGTRSSLMYETIRIINKINPKYVIWENVKNIISNTHKHNFKKYLKALESAGYENYCEILNSKNYNVPQTRERVFVVSIKKDIDTGFKFPKNEKLNIKLVDMIDDVVEDKFYLSDKMLNYALNIDNKINSFSKSVDNSFVNPDIAQTIGCRSATGQRCSMSNYVSDNKQKITVAELKKDNKYKNYRIRSLTPKECFRLMGFSDDDFEKAKEVNSDSQLYKQAGNSIVVNVLEKILENLLCKEK